VRLPLHERDEFARSRFLANVLDLGVALGRYAA